MLNMRKFNFIYMLLAFVGVLSMTSCEHKYADYTPGPQDKNMGVYFPSIATLEVAADATSVDVVIARNNAEAAAEVSLRAEDVDSTDLFSIPSSVSFAAGETETNLTIDFVGALEVGKNYSVRIQLDQSEASQYAISEYVFTIVIPEPWEDWGYGLYVDDYFNAIMAAAGSEIPAGYIAPVPFQKHAENENRIRVVNPGSMEMFSELWGGVPGLFAYPATENVYLEFDVTDPANVKMANPAILDVAINFSDVGACQMGIRVEDGAAIVYEEGKIIFPKGAVYLGYYYEGQYTDFTTANAEGLMMYAVPGVEIKDYAILATYGGMTVEPDNTTSSAIIDFIYGADVDSFKFTVVPGNVTEATEVVEAIIAGSEDYTIFEGVAEENGSSFKVNLTAGGTYTVVTVPYNVEGEPVAEETNLYAFYYPGLGGAEKPKAEITVLFDSVANVTGNSDYESQFPAAYFTALGIIADGNELKTMKIFINDTDVVNGTGMTDAELVAKYGTDVTANIADIVANGSRVFGPYNFKTGSSATAIVVIETLYGDTEVIRIDYVLPDVAPFQSGNYSIVDGDYSSEFTFMGGYQDGQACLVVDGLAFIGTVDTETKTLTFDGFEEYYESNLFNDLSFYYDQAKTQAFGYWSTSTNNTSDGCDLVFSYDENGLVSALNNYFSCLVFNLSDGTLAEKLFVFTPDTTVITKVGGATPSVAAAPASVKAMDVELSIAGVANVETIVAEPYNGARTGRPVLSVSRF